MSTREGRRLSKQQREYLEYLKSDHWRKLRKAKLTSCGHKCERCKARRRLDVHHVRYRNWYDCALSDLRALCRHCHDLAHRGITESTKRRRFKKPADMRRQGQQQFMRSAKGPPTGRPKRRKSGVS